MSQIQRRQFLITAAALFASSRATTQPTKIHRIGCLAPRSRSTPSNPDVFYDSFTQGMRDIGHIEGKNIVIERRFADTNFERLSGLSFDLKH